MTETGLDIHEEILVRLQVNDLIRCKSVCKSWNSLISSPHFAKSQLNYNLKKKVDNNEIRNTRIADCMKLSGYDKEYLVGSSNGLVCVSYNDNNFLVVNPSTHEVKQLKNVHLEYHVYVSGFGYDSSIDDFKVVIGYHYNTNDYLLFDVLELKKNIWRSVGVAPGGYELDGKGILCNGAIHWFSFHQEVIVSFDLSKEVFNEIPPPKVDANRWTLGTMKDCLCIVARSYTNFGKKEDIEIWVMRSYNVQESWERTLPPPGYNTRKPVMLYVPPEDFRRVHIWLLEEGSGAPIMVQNIKLICCREPFYGYRPIRLCTNSECNYNYDEHVYAKSLVSLHGMGDPDSSDGNIDDVISLSTLFL